MLTYLRHPLVLAVALLMTGQGLLHTVLGLRLDLSGTPPGVIGLVMSAYFIGATLGTLFADRVILRIGHIRAFSAFGACLTSATLACVFIPEGWLWGPLRALHGLSMAGLFMCVESWLNRETASEERGRALAAYMTAIYAGLSAGQLLLTTDAPGSGRLVALAAFLISLSALPVLMTRLSSPAIERISTLSLRALYAASPLGVALTLTAGLVSGTAFALAAVFARQRGLAINDVALFMTSLMVGGFALQYPIGRLSDRYGRRAVAALVLLALTATCAALAILPPNLGWGTYLLAAALGGLSFTLYPLAMAHINDRIDRAAALQAASGVLLLYSVASALGPLLASQCMSYFGAVGLPVFLGLASSLAAGFAIWRQIARPALAASLRQPFIVVPRMTPLAAFINPRRAGPAGESAPVHPGTAG